MDHFTWVILELKLESVSYWSKVSVVSTRGLEAIWSCCFWILIFWMLWSWSYYMKQSCYFFIALHHQWNFQTSKWSVNWLALFPSIFKNNKTRRNSRTEQFKEIHATFQTMTKLESNILGGTPVRISRFLNYASTYRLPKDLPKYVRLEKK